MFLKPTLSRSWALSKTLYTVLDFLFIVLHMLPSKDTALLTVFLTCQATLHLWEMSHLACPYLTLSVMQTKYVATIFFKRILSFEFLGDPPNLKWQQWQSKGGGRDQVLELGVSICTDYKFQPPDNSGKRENHWEFLPCSQSPMFPPVQLWILWWVKLISPGSTNIIGTSLIYREVPSLSLQL